MTCNTDYCYHDGKFYRFSSDTKNFDEAKTECIRNAGTLAVVEDKITWEKLAECCGNPLYTTFYWIGLTRCVGTDDLFRWADESVCINPQPLHVQVPRLRKNKCESVYVNPTILKNGFPLARARPCNSAEYYVCERHYNKAKAPMTTAVSPTLIANQTTILPFNRFTTTTDSNNVTVVKNSEVVDSLAPYFMLLPIVMCLLLFIFAKGCAWRKDRTKTGRPRDGNQSVSSGAQLIVHSSEHSHSIPTTHHVHPSAPPVEEDNVYEEVLFSMPNPEQLVATTKTSISTCPSNSVTFTDSSFDSDSHEQWESEKDIKDNTSNTQWKDVPLELYSLQEKKINTVHDTNTYENVPAVENNPPNSLNVEWRSIPREVYSLDGAR